MVKLPLRFRVPLVILALSGLSACTSVGYRCPLDPTETPDSPTACAGMHAANQGAKQGTGGTTSVLIDDQGRRVPTELQKNQPRSPLTGAAPVVEPYRAKAGEPAYDAPKVFQTWVSSFVDAEGNLHEGHHTYFATPGRWRYGSLREESTAIATPGVAASTGIGSSMLRPARPEDRPQGRAAAPVPATPAATTPPKQVSDKAALQNLSAAASAMAPQQKTVPQSAPGVTAPAVSMGE